MADNYVQFSELLELPRGYDEAKIELAAEAVRKESNDDGTYFDVTYSFEKEGLWIRSQASGNGDPSIAAELAHRVMKALDIDKCFILNYAGMCSKLRLSEFGGGAIVVNKYGIKAVDAHAIAGRIARLVSEGVSITEPLAINI